MEVNKQEIIFAKEAKKALEQIIQDKSHKKTVNNKIYLKDDFIHYLNSVPAFISQNGLLQSLTFIKNKDSKLYSVMACFLGDSNIIEELTRETYLKNYIILQKRAIDFSVWLKQLANALYKDPASNN